MSVTRINKTGEPRVVPTSDGRLTISVPIQIKRRSGRKLVTAPSADTAARPLGRRANASANGARARAPRS